MEKYIGRNYIEAEPMTMGEAYEQQLIKAGRAPNESEKNVAGYHIKHDDDSENWLPADMFEKAYERVETPYDMMEVEMNDLYNRSVAIYNIISGEKYSELDETEKALLTAQFYVMSEYLQILYTRSTKMENPDVGCSGLEFSSIIALLYNGFTVRRQSWADKNLYIKNKCLPVLQAMSFLRCSHFLSRQKTSFLKALDISTTYINALSTTAILELLTHGCLRCRIYSLRIGNW